MDKKFTVSKDEELIVEIPRKTRRVVVSDSQGKGLVENTRRLPYLARRTKTAPSGLTIIDLGQVLIEDYYDDLNFAADANNTFDSESGVSTDDLQVTDLQTKADFYLDKLTALLSDAIAADIPEAGRNKYIKDNLIEQHLQIEPSQADYFLIRIRTESFSYEYLNSTNPRWKNKKIVLDASETINYLRIQAEPLFSFIHINNDPLQTGRSKVTSEANFTAAEIDLSLKKNAVIFLCPAFCSIRALVSGEVNYPHTRGDLFTIDPDDGSIGENTYPYTFSQRLYCDYRTFPRNELTPFMILWRTFFFAMIRTYPFTVSLATYQLFYAVSELIKTYPETINATILNGKYIYQDDGINTVDVQFHELDTWEFPNPNLYPAPDDLPTSNSYGTPNQYQAYWNAVTAGGDLLAIVFQDNEFFYVWER